MDSTFVRQQAPNHLDSNEQEMEDLDGNIYGRFGVGWNYWLRCTRDDSKWYWGIQHFTRVLDSGSAPTRPEAFEAFHEALGKVAIDNATRSSARAAVTAKLRHAVMARPYAAAYVCDLLLDSQTAVTMERLLKEVEDAELALWTADEGTVGRVKLPTHPLALSAQTVCTRVVEGLIDLGYLNKSADGQRLIARHRRLQKWAERLLGIRYSVRQAPRQENKK